MTVRLLGTADGKMDDNFVFLTRRVRIPRGDIIRILPAPDGEGTTIITNRGAMRVCEHYAALMWYLYGLDVKAPKKEQVHG